MVRGEVFGYDEWSEVVNVTWLTKLFKLLLTSIFTFLCLFRGCIYFVHAHVRLSIRLFKLELVSLWSQYSLIML